MLKSGAWCAGIAVFIILAGVCSWLSYRIGHISRLRARSDRWIDLKPPSAYDEYENEQISTTQAPTTKSSHTKKIELTTLKSIKKHIEAMKSYDSMAEPPNDLSLDIVYQPKLKFPSHSVLMARPTESTKSR